MDLEEELDAVVALGDAEDEVARLAKQNDHYERALREIESSPYCDYFYGITRTLTEAERSYRTGVTDGHRAAASVARDALALCSSQDRSKP